MHSVVTMYCYGVKYCCIKYFCEHGKVAEFPLFNNSDVLTLVSRDFKDSLAEETIKAFCQNNDLILFVCISFDYSRHLETGRGT